MTINYAKEIHDAIENEQPVDELVIKWLELNPTQDANYTYFLVAIGINSGRVDKETGIEFFKDAERLTPEDPSQKEFYRNWAKNILFLKTGVIFE